MSICKHGELESACEDCETERIEIDNADLRYRISVLQSQLQAQRDAWKEIAEHQYGLLRIANGNSDVDYPVTGALDAWAHGRYLVLGLNVEITSKLYLETEITWLREEHEMHYEEAVEWLKGLRSEVNNITCDPLETWQVRIAQADAAMTQQAYFIVKAYKEALVEV